MVNYRVEYQFPDFSRYRAVISASGKVLWEPAGVFETSCKIDITFYPYDTQVISNTWFIDLTPIYIVNDSVVINMDSLANHIKILLALLDFR